MVRVMAFFGAGVDASAFAVDSPIGQDPFPSFPWSSLRGVVDQVDARGTLSKAIQVPSIFVAIPNLRLDSSSKNL